MTRFAVLRFVGSLQQGLQVTLEWGSADEAIEGRRLGQLQANPALALLYGDWQRAYLNLEELYRRGADQHPGGRGIRLELEPLAGGSRENCDRAAQALEEQLNQWLDSSSGDFQAISRQLNRELSRHPNSQVLIQTDNPQLQRLPWHLWHFWNYHEEVEVILSPLEYQTISAKPRASKTRVLAVLGNSSEINVAIDRKLLQEVPGIHPESRFLEEPSRQEFAAALRASPGWDILFFAGHSCSEQESQIGRLYINPTESLTLNELKITLRQAISQGLKLAIFNSCDGLGLANSLAELQIPQTIIMREPVPDEVAHRFLAFFLKSFAQGIPLVQAVKSAREQLESIQDKLPYATWLPLLYKHPRAEPLVWQAGPGKSKERSRLAPWLLGGLGLAGLLLTGAVVGRANLPKIQAFGDGLSLGEEILDISEAPRLKELGVQQIAVCQGESALFNPPYWKLFKRNARERWERCIHDRSRPTRAAHFLLKSWHEEKHDPETLIYLNNAFLDAQNLDSVTIAVAVPILRNQDGSMKNSNLAQELLRGVAQAQTEVNLSLISTTEASAAAPNKQTLPGQDFLIPRALKPGVGLKVMILDDANDPSHVAQRANMLTQQSEVLGLVGHYASEMTMATVSLYDRQGLAMISPGSTTEELTDDPHPYFFRTVPTTGIEAQSLVDHLVQQGHRKAVVMYNPKSPFTASLWQEFRKRFTAAYNTAPVGQAGDGAQLKAINLAAEDIDLKQVLEEIQQTDRDGGSNDKTAIVLVPDGQVTNSFDNAVEIIRLNQGRNPIAGSWGLYSSKTLAVGRPESFTELVITVPWHPASSPSPDFPEQAKQLWGGPVNTRTATTYDAALAMIEAIARQDNPTRSGVQQQLASADFSVTGATGKVTFDLATGNRLKMPQTLVQVLPCAKRKFGLAFVPLQFPSPEAAGFSCSF